MFSVVLVQDRYIAPYPIVVGLIAFSGVAVVRSVEARKLVNVTVLLAVATFAASSAKPAAAAMLSFKRSLQTSEVLGRGGPWHVSTEAVSNALAAHGVQRGDRVAYIGGSHDFYWARLAGVQVNAEIRQWDLNDSVYSLVPHTTSAGLERSVDIYWASPVELKEKIDGIFYAAGSKAIVADSLPAGGGADGWDHVPGTSFYIHLLAAPPEANSK
jgi:hypothetical protein